ncbi:MAG TPA: cell division protein FtsA, partial [Sphingobacteriaceae bacterium]
AGLSGSIKSFCDHGILSRRNPEKEIAPHDLMQLKNEVGRAIIPPGQSIIFMQPLDFMVDGLADIRDAIGMTGARLEADFQLITAEEKAIENVKQCTRNTGTKDCQVLPVPVASGEAVLSDDEKEEGVVAVDIGASTTSIIIYKNQLIRHVEVIPIGGNSITEDIRQWASLNFQSAELLKMQFGSACEPERDEHIQVSFFNGKKSKLISRRGLTFVIQARVEELLAMIAASIQTTGLAKQLPFGVVLTGGTARLPGIRDLGEKLTGLLFHIGTPEMFLSKKTLQNDQFKVLHSPVYSAAIGLLKMGLSNN